MSSIAGSIMLLGILAFFAYKANLEHKTEMAECQASEVYQIEQ